MNPELDIWACMDCGHVQRENGHCARCKADPLLDLREAHVRTMLVEEDDRLRVKRDNRIRIAAIPLSMVAVVVLCMIPGVGLLLVSLLPFFMGPIVACIAVALLLMAVAGRAFPYKLRFPYVRHR